MLNNSRYSLPAILFLGFVPALLAGLFTQTAPQERPISGTAERSKLVFSQYAVHLGEVRPVGTIPAHFDFVNMGEKPLEILKLEPSCGCLAPRLYEDKKVYAPGEHGRFYVSVKTANETPGPKDYTVKVSYDDGVPQERMVSFRLTVPEKKVSVTPSEVYFYQTQGKADFREIMVEDHRGRNLNILDVVCSTEYAQIQVGEKIIEGSVSRTPIRIDVPAEVPRGKSTALITIQTDDPDYQKIRVPILIWGPTSNIQQTSVEESN
ncbi:DUF1573 domain-containing protein [Planctomicrobium sp.]|nr:DUF1573 domain-containing protein [Planctomicrobium sp.]MBT5019004.1 DUF1573 domain-containing protein [Planctomicrobium sp.]MDB4732951.1 DUF1573 domain-containing protein [Planctomicrobium sp.]